jgi:hypothetical protein
LEDDRSKGGKASNDVLIESNYGEKKREVQRYKLEF